MNLGATVLKSLEAVDNIKQLELGSTSSRNEDLGLGKVGDGLKRVDNTRQLGLSGTDNRASQSGLDKAGDRGADSSGVDDGRIDDGGVGNGGVDNSQAGGGGGSDGKRGKISAPKENLPSRLIEIIAFVSFLIINSQLDTSKSLACNQLFRVI